MRGRGAHLSPLFLRTVASLALRPILADVTSSLRWVARLTAREEHKLRVDFARIILALLYAFSVIFAFALPQTTSLSAERLRTLKSRITFIEGTSEEYQLEKVQISIESQLRHYIGFSPLGRTILCI